MKRISILLSAVVLMLFSCVADESDLLVGTWRVVKSEIHGADFSPSLGDVFTFHSGGTFTVTENSGSKAYGTWEYHSDGKTLTLYNGDGDLYVAEYEVATLTSQTLVLGFDFGLMYGTFTFDRVLDNNSRNR